MDKVNNQYNNRVSEKKFSKINDNYIFHFLKKQNSSYNTYTNLQYQDKNSHHSSICI